MSHLFQPDAFEQIPGQIAMQTDSPTPFGRAFNRARAEQGFRSQAHLDAFYAHLDHVRGCVECQQPGTPMPLDDGLQPTVRECPTGQQLFAASLSERF